MDSLNLNIVNSNSHNVKKIAFAGNGHGGIVALKSLQHFFTQIDIITNDNNILNMLRNSDIVVKDIQDSTAHLVICAGYHSIIPKDTLANKIIINTHPSLLPKYRGMHSLVWAMLNFEKEIGFTIHLMNEYIDDGDILEQFKIVYQNQTSHEIMCLFDDYVEKNLGRVVVDFITKKIQPLKQNRTNASWVAKRNITDCLIDYNRSNQFINMFFRALVRPYPLPMIKIKDRLYEVVNHTIIDMKYEMHNGRVINIENNEAYIKIQDGILVIKDLIDFDTKEKLSAGTILKMGQRLWK
ncbi:MAG TPA: formyltransferase family protein [Chitinophagales bacterium]|jgi:methionyl-tRNA formyltransferase|nr:hypothetical protein [Flavobacterium sp.]HQV77019.1 formyltransferase family protein [Chitinophagales bacterium]HQW77914.1 formyltransferase family protein [Chitinophagales bacterium]